MQNLHDISSGNTTLCVELPFTARNLKARLDKYIKKIFLLNCGLEWTANFMIGLGSVKIIQVEVEYTIQVRRNRLNLNMIGQNMVKKERLVSLQSDLKLSPLQPMTEKQIFAL